MFWIRYWLAGYLGSFLACMYVANLVHLAVTAWHLLINTLIYAHPCLNVWAANQGWKKFCILLAFVGKSGQTKRASHSLKPITGIRTISSTDTSSCSSQTMAAGKKHNAVQLRNAHRAKRMRDTINPRSTQCRVQLDFRPWKHSRDQILRIIDLQLL